MIEIKAAVQPKIGFASHQNAVPLILDLQIENTSEEALDQAVLRLDASPAIISPRTWQIDRLDPGQSLSITDRLVQFDGGMLAALNEALQAQLRFSVSIAERELAVKLFDVECLPRLHWGGMSTLELLAAYCMPNDPAVDRVLKAASEILRAAEKADAINGYNRSADDAWLLVSAIWTAIVQLNLSYALPPASFEVEGQKVRSPSVILGGRLATCLDTSLLFAACLEQAHLHPVIIITKGHAFCGVWLYDATLPEVMTQDAEVIRKSVALGDMIVFETTLAAQNQPADFAQAIAKAKRQIDEAHDKDFVVALDIKRARMMRIRPLGVEDVVARAPAGIKVGEGSLVLPPEDIVPPVDWDGLALPTTPAERLERWQRKLLDLTTRNRLLHVSDAAKVVRPLCYDLTLLEDKLATGKPLTFTSLSTLALPGRNEQLYEAQTQDNLKEEVTLAALEEKGALLCDQEKTKLEARLIELYREARSDWQEGGANTLFLALGFLKWRKSAQDTRVYRAPLLLRPVVLTRKNAFSGIVMTASEEEPRFNLTLLELLRHDFNLDITGLNGALPMSTDSQSVDIKAILTIVRRAVHNMAGFEVTENVVLGRFSFAKYLMWKDMVDRLFQIKENPVVKRLIERGQERYPSAGDYIPPEELDRQVDSTELFLPLPADSSQISAIVASAKNCDFVLEGPPGTGKSQTIANMIAQNLALGRRVLFVAEKIAALNVVYRRLEEKGLHEFCLQLHSNKASKPEVLKQLERAWDTKDELSAEIWSQKAAQLRQMRDRLNEFTALLHKPQPNGMTLHLAIGLSVRNSQLSAPRLCWSENVEHGRQDLDRLRDIVRRLSIGATQVKGIPESFSILQVREWSNAWQDRLLQVAKDFPVCLERLHAATDKLREAVKLNINEYDFCEIDSLCDLVQKTLQTYGKNLNFVFASDYADLAHSRAQLEQLLMNYRENEEKLSTIFNDVASVPLEAMEQEWQAATDKFFLFARGAKKKLASRLKTLGRAEATPLPAEDLPRLRRLQAISAELSGLSSLLQGLPGWRGIKSDLKEIDAELGLAEALRKAISTGVEDAEILAQRRQRIRTLVVDANELLAPNGKIALAAAACIVALTEAKALTAELCSLVGGVANPNELALFCSAVLASPTRLNPWCNWQRVVTEANQAGLAQLVQIARQEESADLSKIFETSYARWFAARVIDAVPRLKAFVPEEHSSDIEIFRKLEDNMSDLAVHYIRARICGKIPDKNYVGKKDGYGILKHQLQLQKRHKPIRQLVAEMGEAFTHLAPCMLMSPLSIAQYLTPEQPLFDLVVFDEASQIAPWDAIGAMARGKQVVIAGDPRQMPPTNFFGRSEDDEELSDDERDAESILDECLAVGLPQHTLEWHYRSRHESLIAFSNSRYYDNRLITFPAAVTQASAVSWRYVPGIYAKGTGRTNAIEAKALVAEAVARLTDPEKNYKTLGIVVLNAEQQRLVEDLLDAERRDNPALEAFFGDGVLEPVFVKNLETVQGDERDIILLGVGYGPVELGAPVMSMNFGPLNRDGGWRRLNVALTRARAEMVLFTSFAASMIDLNRTSARAVRDLKHFIEFAERGPRALTEAVQGSLGGFDSPFEEAVAAALTQKGWQVVTQVGVSRFRIDLGIVHPDRPGDYLVGVECDGAAYHSAATARDRDKVRQAILETLGWKLLRVWSSDWWVDKAAATEKLHRAITSLLEVDRSQHATAPSAPVHAETEENI